MAHIRHGNNVSVGTVSKEENGLERDPRGRQGWGGPDREYAHSKK